MKVLTQKRLCIVFSSPNKSVLSPHQSFLLSLIRMRSIYLLQQQKTFLFFFCINSYCFTFFCYHPMLLISLSPSILEQVEWSITSQYYYIAIMDHSRKNHVCNIKLPFLPLVFQISTLIYSKCIAKSNCMHKLFSKLFKIYNFSPN